MNKPNVENLEKEEERRILQKKKRKTKKMKVSGASVKKLGEIIREK